MEILENPSNISSTFLLSFTDWYDDQSPVQSGEGKVGNCLILYLRERGLRSKTTLN
jgi:hypothetical protein